MSDTSAERARIGPSAEPSDEPAEPSDPSDEPAAKRVKTASQSEENIITQHILKMHDDDSEDHNKQTRTIMIIVTNIVASIYNVIGENNISQGRSCDYSLNLLISGFCLESTENAIGEDDYILKVIYSSTENSITIMLGKTNETPYLGIIEEIRTKLIALEPLPGITLIID